MFFQLGIESKTLYKYERGGSNLGKMKSFVITTNSKQDIVFFSGALNEKFQDTKISNVPGICSGISNLPVIFAICNLYITSQY